MNNHLYFVDNHVQIFDQYMFSQLFPYVNQNPEEQAFLKDVPMSMLEEVKQYYRGRLKIRIKFRGSRKQRAKTDPHNARAHALKSEANRFAVYQRV